MKMEPMRLSMIKQQANWQNENVGILTIIKPKAKVKKIELGNTQIPDANLNDNTVEFK